MIITVNMIENWRRIFKITVFWNLMPCSLVHMQDVAEILEASIINVEDRSSSFF
jgi:sulfite exporter TauE/SafE